MPENAALSSTWLSLASLAVSLFALAILVLIFVLLQRAFKCFSPAQSQPAPAEAPPPNRASAAMLVEAQKTKAQLKPGRSCGHCGTRIKSDPVRAVSVDTQSYLVFACPECKKETLLPQ